VRPLALLLVCALAAACAAGGEDPPRPRAGVPVPQATATAAPAPAAPSSPAEPTRTEAPPGATSAPAACADPLGCYDEPRRRGTFDAELVPEASGLAASRLNEGILYLLDDRPGTGDVHAVRLDGSPVATMAIEGLSTVDGESLAVGPCGERSEAWCLYVGDIGDNSRERRDIAVHRVVEPDLSGPPPAAPLPADVARLTYPGGPEDAEALLVDDLGRVHVVTKAPFDREARATGEARLLRAPTFADGPMEDLGVLPVPPPSVPVQSTFVGNVVTGGDHRDGRVLLRTYDQVLEYVSPRLGEPDAGEDLGDLAGWAAREVPSPFEPQSEALTWAADGCGFLTAGEMTGDIWHVPCRR
jgi:hypothetical protein